MTKTKRERKREKETERERQRGRERDIERERDGEFEALTTEHCDIKGKMVKVLRFYFYYSGGGLIFACTPSEGGVPFASQKNAKNIEIDNTNCTLF